MQPTTRNIPILLHRGQLDIITGLGSSNLVKCGRRFGKSHTAMETMRYRSLTFPHILPPSLRPVNVIICPTAVMATQIFWKPLLRKAASEWSDVVEEVSKSDKRIIFKGANSIDLLVRGLGDDSCGNNLRGLSFYTAWVDEGQDVGLNVLMDEVIGPATEQEGSKVIVSFTPKGIGSELHKRWVESERAPDAPGASKLFSYTSWDNPLISREKLEGFKLSYPPRVYNQEIMGEWESFDGKVFSEFDADKHVVKAAPSDALYYYVGVDFGGINPAIALWGLDKDLNAYVIYTWKSTTRQPVPPSVFLQKVADVCAMVPQVECVSIPDDRSEYQQDLIDTLRLNVEAAPTRTNPDKHIQKFPLKVLKVEVVSRLAVGPDKRSEWLNNMFYQNRLLVLENASNKLFIEEVNTFARKKRQGVITNELDKKNNHIIDALAYSLCSLINNERRMRKFIDSTLMTQALAK